jgi:hypothetical protein
MFLAANKKILGRLPKEPEDRLRRLFIQSMEFREEIETARREFVEAAATLLRQAEAKLSELGVTRDMLREHLRGLGVVA